jgi:RHS repeat-associated protein
MLINDRRFTSGGAYRYGFNGQEKSTEVGSDDYTAQFWEYDSRIERRWNVDPITKAWESGYVCFDNNPVLEIDPQGLDGTPYKVKKGETLTGIAKRAGTSVKDLQLINGIKDPNKIKAGQVLELYALPTPADGQGMVLKAVPELDFKSSPLTNYNNADDGSFTTTTNANTIQLGGEFAGVTKNIPLYAQKTNTLVVGGDLLEEIKKLPSVQNLIANGLKDLASKQWKPEEFYKSNYQMGSIVSSDGYRIYSHAFKDIFTKKIVDNYFFSADNFLGSYGFSMRVSGDGKSIAIAVYDSKTIQSLSDHRKWVQKMTPDLVPTYQRYFWYIPLPKH